ncbi:MAG: phosphonate C-P lyase system protein PhnL [Rhodospirillaceae bacterium]|nr:phosphonate C-P lyase system protein PhnL [Rhodospirillaceae bacterium]
MLEVSGLAKTFTLHIQGGVRIEAFRDVAFSVAAGECLALVGPSGSGKSSVLRVVAGNYLAQHGSVKLRHRGQWVDMATAPHRRVQEVRRLSLGHVSQFLRAIPRVPAVEIVAEPLIRLGEERAAALARAAALLARLGIGERLMQLAPATFSGGEQQRVNIARGFIAEPPILLLDEPTASLDRANRDTVVALIGEAKARGAALLGIFHDADVRARVADRTYSLAKETAR